MLASAWMGVVVLASIVVGRPFTRDFAGDLPADVKRSPVYIQTTLWNCNSSSCKYIHDPGETLGGSGAGGGSSEIEALSAIQIPFKALPTEVQESLPGTERAKEFVLLK